MVQSLSSLDLRIVQVLEGGPLPTSELAREVGEPPETVARRCRSLKRRHALLDLDRVDVGILRSLNGSGASATADLAAALGVDRDLVYRRCQRLQDRAGLLRSETRQSDRTLLFFPGTREVLNRANYGRIRETLQGLRTLAGKYGLERHREIPQAVKEQLRREYREHLAELALGASAPEREQIQALERELMQVLNHTTLSDVVGFLSFRAFHPKVRDWRLEEAVAGVTGWWSWLTALPEGDGARPEELWGLLPGPVVTQVEGLLAAPPPAEPPPPETASPAEARAATLDRLSRGTHRPRRRGSRLGVRPLQPEPSDSSPATRPRH